VLQPSKVFCGGPPREVDAAYVASSVEGKPALELARRLAPTFVLSSRDSGERFAPIPRLDFVRLAHLYEMRKGERAVQKPNFPGAVLALPDGVGCGEGCHSFLGILRDQITTRLRPGPYEAIQKSERLPAVIGYRVLRYDPIQSGGSVQFTAQYWLVYLFNDLFGDRHEGDVEQVTILADKDGHPQTAFFSAHNAGTVREWPKVESQKERAVVYVAKGSHANYFATGTHKTVYGCPKRKGQEDVECDTFSGVAADYADGCGSVWAWVGSAESAPPRSTYSCAKYGDLDRGRIKYRLYPWTGHNVDWGAPKRNIKLKIDWVQDPGARPLIWKDALRAMTRDACYEIEKRKEPLIRVP
jgi:hypothetical protein